MTFTPPRSSEPVGCIDRESEDSVWAGGLERTAGVPTMHPPESGCRHPQAGVNAGARVAALTALDLFAPARRLLATRMIHGAPSP